jgi:hypothetical protein
LFTAGDKLKGRVQVEFITDQGEMITLIKIMMMIMMMMMVVLIITSINDCDDDDDDGDDEIMM